MMKIILTNMVITRKMSIILMTKIILKSTVIIKKMTIIGLFILGGMMLILFLFDQFITSPTNANHQRATEESDFFYF